jgi:hypothetical protein|tara:strand:- start:51 stop:464 length:414 start_codon:yes stop_codon:yes gene_type:complete
MAHEKHIKGDRAELIAAEYFINLGYSVHKNLSGHGPVDMVLIDEDGTGDVILIDVKAVSLRTKNGWKVNRTPTKKQQELDVQLIFVNLDTKEVMDVLPFKNEIKKEKKKKQVDVQSDVEMSKNIIDIKEYMKVHLPE